MITVRNPNAEPPKTVWFHGRHLQLQFGDVTSEEDAKRCKTTAPCIGDIQRAMDFFREAMTMSDSNILVSCDYGASRSPALAYLFIADQLGPGRELEAFKLTLDIRSDAIPNGLVIRLGDVFLKRAGALIVPLKDLHAKINNELFPRTSKP